MRLHLQRFTEMNGATLGRLSGPGGFSLFTIELPWLANRPVVSCVPDGFYALEPHSSNKHPDTYALAGPTVSHFHEPKSLRNVILFHVANSASELRGCIAVGKTIAWFKDAPFLNLSGDAMDILRACLKSDTHNYLTISHNGNT